MHSIEDQNSKPSELRISLHYNGEFILYSGYQLRHARADTLRKEFGELLEYGDAQKTIYRLVLHESVGDRLGDASSLDSPFFQIQVLLNQHNREVYGSHQKVNGTEHREFYLPRQRLELER